jgi:HSP20 family protein
LTRAGSIVQTQEGYGEPTMFIRDPERQLTARVIGPSRRTGCRVETYRDHGTYFIDIDLPGVDPAGVDVAVHDGVMTIRAARGSDQKDCEKKLEISDALDTDRLAASYDDEGVLTISIPVHRDDLPQAA